MRKTTSRVYPERPFFAPGSGCPMAESQDGARPGGRVCHFMVLSAAAPQPIGRNPDPIVRSFDNPIRDASLASVHPLASRARGTDHTDTTTRNSHEHRYHFTFIVRAGP